MNEQMSLVRRCRSVSPRLLGAAKVAETKGGRGALCTDGVPCPIYGVLKVSGVSGAFQEPLTRHEQTIGRTMNKLAGWLAGTLHMNWGVWLMNHAHLRQFTGLDRVRRIVRSMYLLHATGGAGRVCQGVITAAWLSLRPARGLTCPPFAFSSCLALPASPRLLRLPSRALAPT